MSVYVDNERNDFRGMKMCHLVADTLDELHEFADKLHLRREWFQPDVNMPHYDISQGKRRLAVNYGAIEVNRMQLVEMIRKFRAYTPKRGQE